MFLRSLVISAAILAGVTSAVAKSKEVPVIVGVWTGANSAIVAGQGGHWPTQQGSFENPLRASKVVTFEITGQDGRRFWGQSQIEGSGVAAEPFVGTLRLDNKSFVIVDTDGMMFGDLKGKNRLELCYAQVPGHKNPAAVLSCAEMRKAAR